MQVIEGGAKRARAGVASVFARNTRMHRQALLFLQSSTQPTDALTVTASL